MTDIRLALGAAAVDSSDPVLVAYKEQRRQIIAEYEAGEHSQLRYRAMKKALRLAWQNYPYRLS